MSNKILPKNISVVLIIVCSLVLLFSGSAWAGPVKRIALIPFEINSDQDISYIRLGALKMLSARLSWENNVEVINETKIDAYLEQLDGASENKTISQLGKMTGADFIITGSITSFADAYSFDTRVHNMKAQTYFTFFDQTTDINEVIEKINIMTAKINKKIFNRTTTVYEKLEKDKIIDEADLQRMNPERMMPVRETEKAEDDDPWWKIW